MSLRNRDAAAQHLTACEEQRKTAALEARKSALRVHACYLYDKCRVLGNSERAEYFRLKIRRFK